MATSLPPQSAEKHARWVPGFHFLGGFLVMAVLAWTLYRVARWHTHDTYLELLMALALVTMFWYTRAFPMAVQDRLIRLEERLRLQRLLPADLQGRHEEFTPGQLIGMRFASDAELPDIARKVLDGKIQDRKTIKGMVTNWRADHMRA
ncbi:MAG: hypothetical protein JWO05_3447 [Gemmatimonadetes bacterium]|nr:hypothetical protein [Gemmatimonadota bacterium]